jgi:hypothetical protein
MNLYPRVYPDQDSLVGDIPEFGKATGGRFEPQVAIGPQVGVETPDPDVESSSQVPYAATLKFRGPQAAEIIRIAEEQRAKQAEEKKAQQLEDQIVVEMRTAGYVPITKMDLSLLSKQGCNEYAILAKILNSFGSQDLRNIIRTKTSSVLVAKPLAPHSPHDKLSFHGLPVEIYVLTFRGRNYEFQKLDSNVISGLMTEQNLADARAENGRQQILELQDSIEDQKKDKKIFTNRLVVALSVVAVLSGAIGYVAGSKTSPKDSDNITASIPEDKN